MSDKTHSVRITPQAKKALEFLAAQTGKTQQEAASDAIKAAWRIEAQAIQNWLDSEGQVKDD